MTAFVKLNVPFTFVSRSRCQSSPEMASSVEREAVPALLTRTSIVPKRLYVVAAKFSTCLKSRTSTSRPITAEPGYNCWSSVAVYKDPVRSAIATLAPSIQNVSAMPRPIPRAPPVTMAPLSSNWNGLNMILLISLQVDRVTNWRRLGSK